MTDIAKNKDCLNTIRLLGAFQVFYYHTITHLHISMPDSVTKSILFIMGVPVFFFLSGYLNWFSSTRSLTASDYYKKRFWRIYPELWVAVLFEVLTIVILYKEPINWLKLGAFTITQGTVFQFWTPDFLRGYGCGCPNGALWTICMIIQYYIVAYPLCKVLKNKGLTIWLAVLIASWAVGLLSNWIIEALPSVAGKLYGQLVFRYFWLFFLGAFVARFSEVVLPFLKTNYLWLLLLSLIVYLTKFDINTGLYGIIRSSTFCLGAIGLAYALPRLNIKTDISYSVYIYHMIIVNAFIQLGLTGKWLYFVLVGVITAMVSIVSTLTIGKASQKWKRLYTNSSL